MKSDLKLAFFQFHLTLTTPANLPEYKGSTFHGGVIHALQKVSPQFRSLFFPDAPGRTNPFVLLPPATPQRSLPAGTELKLGIILYGMTISFFPALFAAVEKLGSELGLGRSRGRFEIMAVEELHPDSPLLLFADGKWLQPWQGTTLSRLFMTAAAENCSRVTLHPLNGLRLKGGGALLRTPPPLRLLLDRLIGRLNSLISFYGEGEIVPHELKRKLLHLAEDIHLDSQATGAHWHEWPRPPKPGREAMIFGSLQGDLVYTGTLTPLLPWLRIGEWTGVGGKTSFGLGLYTLREGDEQ